MVQVFVKFDNCPTLVLNLEDNYTISSKELYVKCCDLFFTRFHEKSLKQAITDGSANFIVNSHITYQTKFIRFRSKNQYWNTSTMKDSTINFGFSFHSIKLDKNDIETINNILDSYY
jgi:hypothetical protein